MSNRMIILSAVLMLAGCGGDQISVSLGALEGSDSLVAVVRGADTVVAYVCGGPSSFRTHSRWFERPVEAADDEARLEKDGWSLSVSFESEVHGTLSDPESNELISFRAVPKSQDTVAGLYDAFDRGCRTGVIVMQDSPESEPRVQGTWCDSDGRYAQVERATGDSNTDPMDDSGFSIEVERPDGRAVLRVAPVVP